MLRMFTTAAVLALGIVSAQAGDATLYFGDLNLSNPGDANILASRVQSAAETACAADRPETGRNSQFYRSIYRACIARTGQVATARVMALSGQPPRFASK